VDGADRPRSVPDLEQAVTREGWLPSRGEPFAGVDAGLGTPGELMRLVADGLTARGLDVRPPGDAFDRCLTIGCPEARCTVSVSDFGDVEWQWSPAGLADPGRIADMAAALLAGQAQDRPVPGSWCGYDCLTFKGLVGLELRARGFDVGLEVHEDEDHLDVRAEIVVTSHGSAGNAAVHVTDDGSVTWTRDDWAEAATLVRAPGYRRRITDPVKLAAAVVTTITRAMSQATLAGR
jgi:hypothetical protein